MSTTVDQIQIAVAAKADLVYSSSEISTKNYGLRLEYINQREKEWESALTDWPTLYREFYSNSTDASNASITLPQNFNRFAANPEFDGYEYTKIRPNEKIRYTSSDRVFWTLTGDDGTKTAVLNTGVLASGVTVFIPYYASTGSLASPADICMCPNRNYLITGVTADVWESRQDARYIRKQEESFQILQNMIESENTPDEGASDDRVKTVEETKYNFRLGRD